MAVIHPTLLPENAAPSPHRITVERFDSLREQAQLAAEPVRLELIGGVIYEKMGQNEPHIFSVMFAARALRAAFGPGFEVVQQIPLHLGKFDAPEPDITVLRGDPRQFESRGIQTEDVALVVEIADTRLDTAKGPKLALYARHGIAEYWIVDLRARTLEVRRGPRADETWTETRIYSEEESATANGNPVAVADLLPKPPSE